MRQCERKRCSSIIFVSNTHDSRELARKEIEQWRRAFNEKSATVYEFPLRGRFAQANRQRDEAAEAASLPRIAFGGAWYHDAAMEAERLRKN